MFNVCTITFLALFSLALACVMSGLSVWSTFSGAFSISRSMLVKHLNLAFLWLLGTNWWARQARVDTGAIASHSVTVFYHQCLAGMESEKYHHLLWNFSSTVACCVIISSETSKKIIKHRIIAITPFSVK